VFIAGRASNPRIRIARRVGSAVRRLAQAGAHQVVSPPHEAACAWRRRSRPAVIDFLEVTAPGQGRRRRGDRAGRAPRSWPLHSTSSRASRVRVVAQQRAARSPRRSS
jgi:hypothetical protein